MGNRIKFGSLPLIITSTTFRKKLAELMKRRSCLISLEREMAMFHLLSAVKSEERINSRSKRTTERSRKVFLKNRYI